MVKQLSEITANKFSLSTLLHYDIKQNAGIIRVTVSLYRLPEKLRTIQNT